MLFAVVRSCCRPGHLIPATDISCSPKTPHFSQVAPVAPGLEKAHRFVSGTVADAKGTIKRAFCCHPKTLNCFVSHRCISVLLNSRLLRGTSYPVPPYTAPASKQGFIVAGFMIDRQIRSLQNQHWKHPPAWLTILRGCYVMEQLYFPV